MSEARINIRVDEELKEDAEMLFDELGMNMTTAISIFLKKSVEEQEIPFVVGTKSLSYAGEYTSSQVTKQFQRAVAAEISAKKDNNIPIAKYDEASKKAYLEYPDGKVEYISNE